MDYPCAKFGECTFSRFGFIMQTHSLSHTQRITDTAKCLTHATTVGVMSKNSKKLRRYRRFRITVKSDTSKRRK